MNETCFTVVVKQANFNGQKISWRHKFWPSITGGRKTGSTVQYIENLQFQEEEKKNA